MLHQNKQTMKTTQNIESKVKASFLSENGYEPQNIKFDGDYVYADGFWCRILNGNIKKTNKIA